MRWFCNIIQMFQKMRDRDSHFVILTSRSLIYANSNVRKFKQPLRVEAAAYDSEKGPVGPVYWPI